MGQAQHKRPNLTNGSFTESINNQGVWQSLDQNNFSGTAKPGLHHQRNAVTNLSIDNGLEIYENGVS